LTDDEGIDVARATKSRLRSSMRVRIASLPPAGRAAADGLICTHLAVLAGRLGVAFVLGYLALPDEVRLDRFLASMVETGRRTLVPRAEGGRLRFSRWRPCARLGRDDEGVLAPQDQMLDELPDGVGLVVVPGRAFDAAGRRLGRGGGYYDRLLATVGSDRRVVGAAYQCQIVEEVPHESHDADVGSVVTEAGWRGPRRGSAG
jgi:5-formyltetrahydrofolate cyclo-ligase